MAGGAGAEPLGAAVPPVFPYHRDGAGDLRETVAHRGADELRMAEFIRLFERTSFFAASWSPLE
ncbi:hypothetical protein LK07_15835 [Streptomyces pluripotens]|uniref:Uncharacterized protein n=1 Tax=Streptomyces pluripotens TaxID=1355015 RepID=A0A221NZB9_9ACTN|nr:hypothetical protein LK06_014705 [Streptomyces pluripotens]ASN25252.1 hypothetical protein LK07_15835 [Streptomyces pluripotens]KIE27695.1 hypothetical protein LK08_07350 [Streptomyces sp. MUSC 125]